MFLLFRFRVHWLPPGEKGNVEAAGRVNNDLVFSLHDKGTGDRRERIVTFWTLR